MAMQGAVRFQEIRVTAEVRPTNAPGKGRGIGRQLTTGIGAGSRRLMPPGQIVHELESSYSPCCGLFNPGFRLHRDSRIGSRRRFERVNCFLGGDQLTMQALCAVRGESSIGAKMPCGCASLSEPGAGLRLSSPVQSPLICVALSLDQSLGSSALKQTSGLDTDGARVRVRSEVLDHGTPMRCGDLCGL
jgi:hypothetical protein